MKKLILSLFIIFIFLNINTANSYSSISATKTEIDSIKCDLNYTWELRQWFSYEFSDFFSNAKNSDLKIEEIKVHTYEQSNYNNSTDLLQFDFTPWIKAKNNILKTGDSWKLIESTNKYQIINIDNLKNQENFKITYTAKYYRKASNWNFTKWPYYHTECKDYKIGWCGDWILDKDYWEKCDFNDPEKKNWWTNGCSNTCQPKQKNTTKNQENKINPTCNSNSASVNIWTEKLDSVISCSGTDVSRFEINCGNWQTFFKNYSTPESNASFSKICNYTKTGNYIATCKVDDKTINNSCKKNIKIKEQIKIPKKEILPEIKEDLSEYEKYVKQTIFKYKANKIKLNKILKEENERWIWLIKLPKILPKTWTPIEQRTKKLQNSKLNLNLINSRFRLAWNKNSDINFWKQVLTQKDKNAKKYIVIPSSWLVMPVNDIPNTDIEYSSLISWREIKVNKYLKTWAMEYAWTSINGYWKVWNKVIFAHSSYFKSDIWRYKTDFQKIIELDSGEEIWIYEKINWEYKLFKYKTVQSYNTNPSNVSVLKPWIWKNLTLFTCTPIGWIEWRWIIEAKFINNEKFELENKISFNNINSKIKWKIDILVYKISKLEEKKKKEKILKIFKLIIIKKPKIKDIKILNIFNYLKHKLALEYYK